MLTDPVASSSSLFSRSIPASALSTSADLAIEGVRVLTPVTCVIAHDAYHRSVASPALSGLHLPSQTCCSANLRQLRQWQ